MSSEPGAEKALDKLKKLPHNLKCANCQAFAQHGHGAVVMKYGIFVCHTCKSAHQSYSHLCKSVTMSFWTHKEVDQLRKGGNKRARATYLANMDPSNAIKPGVSLQAAKTFVALAYNEKLWYQEGAVEAEEEDIPKPRKAVKPKLRKAPQVRQVTPAVDLLCLDDPAPAPPAAAASSSGFAFIAPPPGEPKAASNGFAAFESAPAAPADLFAAAPAAPPAAPFAAFGGAKVVSPAPAPAAESSFDPFGDSGVLKPTPATNGHSNGHAAPASNGAAPMMNGSAPMMNGAAPMMNGSAPRMNGAAFTPQPMALGVARPDAAHAISSMGRLAMAPPPVRAPSAPAFAAFGLPPSAVPLSRGASAPQPPHNGGWAASFPPPPPPPPPASCSSPPMKHNILQPSGANISNMFNF